MKYISFLLALVLFLGCSDKRAVAEDNNKIQTILESSLSPGMKATEVAAVFSKHGTPLAIYNRCTKKSENLLTECQEGYSAIGIIELGNKSFALGNGQAQIYLTFDADKQLVDDFFYELYYEKQH